MLKDGRIARVHSCQKPFQGLTFASHLISSHSHMIDYGAKKKEFLAFPLKWQRLVGPRRSATLLIHNGRNGGQGLSSQKRDSIDSQNVELIRQMIP